MARPGSDAGTVAAPVPCKRHAPTTKSPMPGVSVTGRPLRGLAMTEKDSA